VPKGGWLTRSRLIFLVAVIGVLLVAGGLAWYSANRSSEVASVPKPLATPVVAVTVPYGARPGPKGTKILTETVDQLTLAVPASWMSPAADELALPIRIDTFAQQAPPLSSLLQAEAQVAAEAAIRLFAYQPVAPAIFVSVVSFSSPDIPDLTPAGVAAMVAVAKKAPSTVAVTSAQLPVGLVLELNSSYVSQKQPIVIEDVVLIAGGRTLLIEMVAETNVAGVPPVFGQIAQSLRLA
jgi:hypothetical protein